MASFKRILPLLVTILALPAACARANTYVVDSTASSNSGACTAATNDCPLGAAITQANGRAGADTIAFASNVSTISLTQILPTLTDAAGVTFTGATGGNTTIQRLSGTFRIFNVAQNATVTLQNLDVNDGSVTGTGGAINNAGTLAVFDCALFGNVASGSGGAIYNFGGQLTVQRCTFFNNGATSGDGGAIFNGNGNGNTATAVVADSYFENNGGLAGGAIFNSSSLTLRRCTFAGNASTSGETNIAIGGGALANSGTALAETTTFFINRAQSYGGGVLNRGGLTLRSCTFSQNVCNVGGGSVAVAGGTAVFGNTIFDAGTTENVLNIPGTAGSFTSEGFNISSDGTGPSSSSDRLNTDSRLDPQLTDDGIHPSYLGLSLQSPAVDGGFTTISPDVRGQARPVDISTIRNAPGGNGADVGAFEAVDGPQGDGFLSVNTLADTNDGLCSVADCSLREALNLASADASITGLAFAENVRGTITLGGTILPTIRHELSIFGPGADVLTINGGGRSGIFALNQAGDVAMFGLTLSNGNSASGGAISATTGSSLTLNDCVLSNNRATSRGGAIFTSGMPLTLDRCTLNGNSSADGGGLYFIGNLTTQSANVINCTFDGNSASAFGGSVYLFSGLMKLESTTHSSNAAPQNGGAIASFGGATTRCEVHNSIIAGNSGGDVQFVRGATNTFLSQGYNIVGAGNAIANTFNKTGDQNNVTDPKLGALALNDGSTLTRLPAADSPALNRGDTDLFNDQRGVGRPQGSADDIGAAEVFVRLVVTVTPTLSPQAPFTNDDLTVTPNATVSDGSTPFLLYMWKRNGEIIPGEDEATLQLSKPGNGDAGDVITVEVMAFANDGTSTTGTQSVTVQNALGVTVAPTLSPAPPFTNDDLIATPNATVSDGSTPTLTYVWKKNGTVIPDETTAILRLSKPGNGDAGDIVNVEVTATARDGSRATGTQSVTVRGALGVTVAPTLSPQAPFTNDDLTVTPNAAVSDGSTPVLAYVWKRNGAVIPNENQPTLQLRKPGNGDAGDVISVEVTATARDGSRTTGTQNVTVQNALTVAVAPMLAPTAPLTDDDLIVTPNAAVSDGSAPTLSYVWKKNGEIIPGENQPTLQLRKPGNGDAGDVITVEVTAVARDGSRTTGTQSATVQAPQPLGVTVAPTLSPEAPFTDDDLIVTANATVSDGSAPTLAYRWKRNGAIIAGETSATLQLSKPGNGDAGDTISVEVTATARDGNTATGTRSVTVQTPPPLTVTVAPTLSPEAPFTDDDLVATANATVSDGSTPTLSYVWKKNGVVIPGEISAILRLSKPGNGDRGDVVTVEVTATASDGTSATGTQSVTVRNPPSTVALAPTLSPTAPFTNDVLTVTPNATVSDGSAPVLSYVWKKNGVVIPNENAATLQLRKPGNGDKGDIISVEVTATADDGSSATGTRSVTVQNSQPVAISSQGEVPADTEKGFVLRFFDADGDAVTYKRVGGPRNGVTADIRVDPTDGVTKLFYKSRPFYGGVDVIRFVVFDSSNKQSNESTLGIRVLYTPPPPANRAPIAGDTNLDTFVGTSEIKGLLGTDPDGDAITFRVVGNAKFGKSEIRRDTDGFFKLFYTSLPRFFGPDVVTYIVTDSRGKESNLARVNINFVNRSPVALGNRVQVASGVEVSQFLFADDPDNDAVSFRLVNNPRFGRGEVKLDPEGKWRFFYTSLPGYVGTDQITFIAIDPFGKESEAATIDINVVRVTSTPGSALASKSAAPSSDGS